MEKSVDLYNDFIQYFELNYIQIGVAFLFLIIGLGGLANCSIDKAETYPYLAPGVNIAFCSLERLVF